MKNQVSEFLKHRIWEVRLEDRQPWMAFLIKQLRIILIVFRNFTKDRLQVQAASLTYYSLLSVVPLVAMAFAIAKGFGFESALEEELTSLMTGHDEVVEQIMVFANRMLDNTQGGVLAGVGIVVLLWSVMQLLISIENSFNEIWQVAKARSWVRKFTEYFSIMLLAPIMIILSSSITVLVTSEVQNLISEVDFLSSIGSLVMFSFKLIPYVLIWLLFTFIYMVMPNTKVSFKSAFIAGVIAGTAFQAVQWGYIHFQVGVSKYNAIYGSFAALPLFLIWLNISWLLTLIGAEVAYANQFVGEIKNEIDGKKLSLRQQHIVAMMLASRLAYNFENGKEPETAHELCVALDLPFGVTSRVLSVMRDVHLVIEVDIENDSEHRGFMPARNLESMTVGNLVTEINKCGETKMEALTTNGFRIYSDRYSEIFDQDHSEASQLKVSELP